MVKTRVTTYICSYSLNPDFVRYVHIYKNWLCNLDLSEKKERKEKRKRKSGTKTFSSKASMSGPYSSFRSQAPPPAAHHYVACLPFAVNDIGSNMIPPRQSRATIRWRCYSQKPRLSFFFIVFYQDLQSWLYLSTHGCASRVESFLDFSLLFRLFHPHEPSGSTETSGRLAIARASCIVSVT